MNPVFIILLFSIITGQLIKIPILGNQAPPLLDIVIATLDLLGLLIIKFHLKNPPGFIKASMVFILICIFSLIFTPLKLAPQEILISFFYTIRFSLYVLFGWLIYSGAFAVLNKTTLKLLSFSGIGLAILGILQFIFLPDLYFLSNQGWDPHFFRAVSTFLDPNFAGAYFVLTLMLITQKIIIQKKYQFLIIHYTLYSIPFFALLTTFSRSSYGMFLISFLALSYFLKSWKMAIVSIALFLGLINGFQIYEQLVAKPKNIDRVESASFRLSTWQQGFELFQKSPVLGMGFNTYRYALKEYKLADEQFLESRGSTSNDSSLLFVLSTTGILGFFAYLYFLFSVFKFAWKKNLILFSALCGLIFHSIFANSLFYPFILFWIISLVDPDIKL